MAASDPKQTVTSWGVMDKSQFRIVLGLLAAVFSYFILDIIFPIGTGIVSLWQILLPMSCYAAVACAIGDFIASDSFVIPASILATFTWLIGAAFSMHIGMQIDDVSVDRIVQNLPFAIIVPAAAIGAKLGIMTAAWRRRAVGA